MMRARIAMLALLVLVFAPVLIGCQRSTTKSHGSKSKSSTPSPVAYKDANEPLAFPLEILQVAAVENEKQPAQPQRAANRLARESSPYLLLHAHNPVEWYPWGPEAFEVAKRENKPIFLSVGYSSCYWCHVMERLVFSNEEIARSMNENFINIKVDREERPDIDEVYMTSLQVYLALTQGGGSGGWPLSMFLTPAGQPIAGGSYFPPQDIGRQFGFPKVAGLVIEAWKKQHAEVEKNAATLAELVRREMRGGFDLEKATLDRATVQSVVRLIVQGDDPEFGGIDFSLDQPDAPKFPMAPRLALLLDEVRVHRDPEAARVLYHTLDAMAAGGIRDHLSGGFHRYSTDRQWRVPHFEKMLYDNAQLLDVYAEAYRLSNKPHYREVADDIITWLLSEMINGHGAFFSAIDAETDAIEGQYYVWSPEEVDRLLGPDAAIFRRVYGLNESSAFEPGHVLYTSKSLEQLAVDERIPPRELGIKLNELRRKLLVARRDRKKPLVDDKVLASWNGLTIRALANAGAVFSRRDCLEASQRAAMFVLTSMRDKDGRLLRSFRGEQAKQLAFLDDYAYLVEGLLALHWATRDPKWLNASRHLTDIQLKLFWDEQGKGFFFTTGEHEQLIARFKDGFDGPTPSANSVTVRNLLRLAAVTGDDKYRQVAQETLESFAGSLKKTPRGLANMALALSEWVDRREFRTLADRINKPAISDDKRPMPDTSTKPLDAPSPLPTPREPKRLAIEPSDASAVPNASAIQTKSDTAKVPLERVTAKAFLSTSKLVPGKTSALAIALNVDDGWHINANPAGAKFLVPTSISMKSAVGCKASDWTYPKGREFKVEGATDPIRVYEGEVVIIGQLEVPTDLDGTDDSLELTVRYQACNEAQCESPRTMKFAAKLPIAAAGEAVESINGTIFKRGSTEPAE